MGNSPAQQNLDFQKLLNKLNPAQRLAVETIEGPAMVIAGPGTGKTQILTLRIANILTQTQINPENILALTYTDSGVNAMRRRLVDIVGTAGYRVNIFTFHGFCNDIIQSYPEEFGHLVSAEPITELDQVALIEQHLLQNEFKIIKPFGKPELYIKALNSAIGNLKKEKISPMQLKQILEQQEMNFRQIPDLVHEKGVHKGKMKGKYIELQKKIDKNKELLQVYQYYDSILKQQKSYDFADMILEVVNMLQTNQEFLLMLQEKYQYILVDEHQDTNAAQNKLVELLSNFHENPNVFVVGDEKQAIYRFQGASIENFLYFKTLYPTAALIHLEANYRSTQSILDGSGSVIKNNSIQLEIPDISYALKAQNAFPSTAIQIAQLDDYYGEYYYVVEQIQKDIESGITPHEIAVLVKENKDLNPLMDALEQKKIAYINEGNANILQDHTIQKIILLFRFLNNLADDSLWVKVMHLPCFKIPPLDIYQIFEAKKQKHISMVDFLKSESLTNEIGQFFDKVWQWQSMLYNQPFDVFFKEVLEKSGILTEILNSSQSVIVLDKVTTLFDEIKKQIEKNPHFHLSDFLTFINLLEVHELQIKHSVKTRNEGAVRIMTAHRSKGLEFEKVYILNLHDKHWGNNQKRMARFDLPWDLLGISQLGEADIKDDDERRLLYVAMTRAKKQLCLSYSRYSQDGKEQVVSQFVNEMDDQFKQIVDTTKFNQRFVQEKHVILQPVQAAKSHFLQQIKDNQSYFQQLFKRKGFAPTHLNNYLACPWRYFFNNLLELPSPMDKTSMYGLAIHSALNQFFLYAFSRQDLPYLLNVFTQKVDKLPLIGQDKRDVLTKGKQSLTNFFHSFLPTLSPFVESEVVLKGVVLNKDVTLTGRIDLIEQEKEKATRVKVYDFKTGRPKSRGEIEGSTANSDGNYKRQLIFYKLLLDLYHNNRVIMDEGIVAFVDLDAKGGQHSESFIIDQQEVDALKTQIIQITQEILTLDFLDKGCNKRACEACNLRKTLSL